MNEGCGYVKRVPLEIPDHECQFGEWYSYNAEVERRYWECGEYEERSHTLNTVTSHESYQDGSHKVIQDTKCQTCDYTAENTFDEACVCDILIDDKDEKNELWACACGYQIPVLHIFDNGTLSDGVTTYNCINSGCSYSYQNEHIHTTDTRFDKVSEENYCGDSVLYCTDCNMVLESVPVYDHDFLETDNAASIDYDCINCDYSYEQIKNPFLQSSVVEEEGMSRTLTLDEEE